MFKHIFFSPGMNYLAGHFLLAQSLNFASLFDSHRCQVDVELRYFSKIGDRQKWIYKFPWGDTSWKNTGVLFFDHAEKRFIISVTENKCFPIWIIILNGVQGIFWSKNSIYIYEELYKQQTQWKSSAFRGGFSAPPFEESS